MKEVVFDKLSIQNFLSIGKEVLIPLDIKGIHGITGINKDKNNDGNGVGKSSIVNALFFALFGETLTELKKEDIVNNLIKKDCLVKLWFAIDDNGKINKYRIERGINPSTCKIFLNDVENTSLSTIPVTNNFIKNLINSNETLFASTITMGINNTIPFMALKKNEKRAFIESIVRLEVFKWMTSFSREVYNDTLSQITNAKSLETEYKTNQETYLKEEENFIVERTKKYEAILAKIHALSRQVDSIKASFHVINTDDYNDLCKSQQELSYFIIAKQSALTEWKTKKGIAENSLTLSTNKIDEFERKIQKIKDMVDIATDLVKTSDEEIIKLIEEKTKKIQELHNEKGILAFSNTQLKTHSSDLQKIGGSCSSCKRPYLEKDIENNKKQIEDNNTQIESNLQKIKEIETHIVELNNQISYFNTIKALMLLESSLKNEKDCAVTSETEVAICADHINELDTIIIDKQSKNTDILNKKQEWDTKINENKAFKISLETVEKMLDLANEEYHNTVTSKNPFTELLVKVNEKLTAIDSKLTELTEKLNIYEVIKFITSDEGVKAFIIKKILGTLNERINHYLIKTDANCRLTFDEYFDDKIINDRNQECTYKNFSNGERKRIDLAVLWAFMDIRRIQGDVRINLVWYDELLDSAISVACSELVLQVLKERLELYNESAYIITHRIENLKNPIISNVIYLEKLNGITKVRI